MPEDSAFSPSPPEDPWLLFNRLTSAELSEEEKILAREPSRADPEAERFMAVHWHPEWVPLDLIRERLGKAFPRARDFLAIPTPHDRLAVFGPYAGAEADAFDRGYGLKVHLLIHLPADRLPRAGPLVAMLERSRRYRIRRLMDTLELLAAPSREEARGAELAGRCARLLLEMIERSGLLGPPATPLWGSALWGSPREETFKNRLLPDFITGLAGQDPLLSQALKAARAAKRKIKENFDPAQFYAPREIVEEARGLGAGLVIPHPPAFWPILLDDLDVDGWEIWNPSTPRHAFFLAEALARANRVRRRRLLAFMGDDAHLSSKLRRSSPGEKDSSDREIGFQDPWRDPELGRLLAETGQSLAGSLDEYRARLG